MQNTYRSSSRDNFNTGGRTTFAMTRTKSENNINIYKREKLKTLLIEKFTKKFGLQSPLPVIQDEISKFLQSGKLQDADLKKLEEKLIAVISDIKSQDSLRKGLAADSFKIANQKLNNNDNELRNLKVNLGYTSNNNKNSSLNMDNLSVKKENKDDIVLPEICKNSVNNDAMSVSSKMSGASHLSKFNKNNAKTKQHEKEELEFLKSKSSSQPEKFDFTEEGDEWNAIVAYNQKLFMEEKAHNKIKDLDIKKRIKSDLDHQVKDKLLRKHEESLKNKEYDQAILNHCEFLNEMERQREREKKELILKEKESRDLQLKDEKRKKRIEIIKEKKFDRETVKNIKLEIEKEKEKIFQKKMNEQELLHKTLRENEINRIKKIEEREKEKLDDMKFKDEYNQVILRQDLERAQYFKKIERNSANHVNTMAQTVLSDIEKKNNEEDEKMRVYLEEKERR